MALSGHAWRVHKSLRQLQVSPAPHQSAGASWSCSSRSCPPRKQDITVVYVAPERNHMLRFCGRGRGCACAPWSTPVLLTWFSSFYCLFSNMINYHHSKTHTEWQTAKVKDWNPKSTQNDEQETFSCSPKTETHLAPMISLLYSKWASCLYCTSCKPSEHNLIFLHSL